ncbi:MAG TPA: A/G-specific adenine glycosylase [Spirochaetales bacterium]|nr:A/G-specific adenine glycosylase [Spirochaetales bacterium]HQK33996.1 A/G-specific adenine glycosylase [Spirochaetales bacterium]
MEHFSVEQFSVSNFDVDKALREIYSDTKSLYRDFPWRNTTDPWEILVSEVMLQQTQTKRVVSKYLSWFEHLPDIHTCARASKQEILSLWSGLGYNSRALRLQECARIICERYEGIVPRSRKELQKLPGIGTYTSGAICAFAYNEPYVFLETNIRTVLIYWLQKNPDFVLEENCIDDLVLESILKKMIEAVQNSGQSIHTFYYMLMDYGAFIKKTYGNFSIYAKKYTKQSSFKGSVREVRGAIVKALCGSKSITYDTLESLYDPQNVTEAIDGLVAEGIIKRNGSTLELA